MRKYIYYFVVSFILILMPAKTYAANDILDLEYVQIRDGLENYYEATFEDSKTIYGEGESGVEITFYLYKRLENDTLELLKEKQVIGASGIFTQDIELPLDTSYLLITVKNDNKKIKHLFVINRKETVIKEKLENIVALPGLTLEIE